MTKITITVVTQDGAMEKTLEWPIETSLNEEEVAKIVHLFHKLVEDKEKSKLPL